jgi:hypothetical protein
MNISALHEIVTEIYMSCAMAFASGIEWIDMGQRRANCRVLETLCLSDLEKSL